MTHPFTDIDECHSNPHACNGTRTSGCVNSVGDYSCLCKNGYKATDDGHSCEGRNAKVNLPGWHKLKQHFLAVHAFSADVDECDANPCNPLTSTHCTNTDGDYRCYCKKGYQPSMDAHSCEGMQFMTYEEGCVCTCSEIRCAIVSSKHLIPGSALFSLIKSTVHNRCVLMLATSYISILTLCPFS